MCRWLNCKVMPVLLTGLLGLIEAGCASRRDLTPRTDYQAGTTYRVVKPVFLFVFHKDDRGETPKLAPLGYSATPKSVEEVVRAMPNDPQIAGLLAEGVLIRISSAKAQYAFGIGTFTKVEAVVVSGNYTGRVVDLSLISRGFAQGAAFVDPEYLVPATILP